MLLHKIRPADLYFSDNWHLALSRGDSYRTRYQFWPTRPISTQVSVDPIVPFPE